MRVGAVALDVVDQAPVGEQADRVQRHAQGSIGRIVQRACVSGGQHIDAPSAELDGLRAELHAADIVISSTDAPHRILRHADIAGVMASRRGRRLVIIDIAVPRDVEATIKALPDVTLFDIDDLEQVAEANLNGRHHEAERAEGIIWDELSHFRDWRRAAPTGPAVRALWAWAESIRQKQLAEIEERSNSVTPGSPPAAAELDDRADRRHHVDSLHYLFGFADAENGLAQVVPIDSTASAADFRPADAAGRARVATDTRRKHASR